LSDDPIVLGTYDESLARLLFHVPAPRIETTALDDAHGRYLGEHVIAARSQPPAAVSAMDGYAISGDELAPGACYTVVGISYPGAPYLGRISKYQAVRVTTGAWMPEGASRVLVDEIVADCQGELCLLREPGAKTHVRAAGSDFRLGTTLVMAGTRLTAPALMAAAAGHAATVRVFRRPVVRIIATGDELARGLATIEPDQTADSVSIGVSALATDWGGIVRDAVRCGDAAEALQCMLRSAVQTSDTVVVIGGASGSERDLARGAASSLGAETIFQGVAIKPGRPVWAARCDTHARSCLIIGLPGNPLAAFITARLFLAPVLAKMACGTAAGAVNWRSARLLTPLEEGSGKEAFLAATTGPDGLRLLPSQESSSQGHLADLRALIRRAPSAPAGADVAYLDVEARLQPY